MEDKALKQINAMLQVPVPSHGSPGLSLAGGGAGVVFCLQSFHLIADVLTKRVSLKGDIAQLVTGQIFSASQTALPISWLAGIQLQLEHT